MAARKLKPIEERDPYAAAVLAEFDRMQEADELVGLRGCNSRHGGLRKAEPCIYRKRSTDPGCAGCSEQTD